MFFTRIMSKRTMYSFLGLAIAVFFTWMLSGPDEANDDFSEIAKISLRDVGNQLLLSKGDSTSLILPVIKLNDTKFELSFEDKLSFEPGTLVSIVKNSFQKSELSNNYRAEVVQCADKEVAYSYKVSEDIENTIVPCIGRFLPIQCYTIQFRFLDRKSAIINKQILLYGFIFSVFFLAQWVLYKRKSETKSKENNAEYIAIGSFHFYPEQSKLVKEITEISLSNKECELLEIFVANPNQIIKRDELTKKVWEDNGVFVGRSLDTYISKLRKKLKDDTRIKLTNVHGVGYKLEINN